MPGDPVAGITEHDGNGIALAQITAMQTRGKTFEPGALMPRCLIVEGDARASAGGCRHIVIGSGVGSLQRAPVAEKAKHHANTASVVDSVTADGVHETKRLQAANLELTARLHRHMAVQHRVHARAHDRPGVAYQFRRNPRTGRRIQFAHRISAVSRGPCISVPIIGD
ncbi:MAG: hypothetical protein OET44_07125 [Gammaproteobacteria bacterium]|nr:hypothetical protein [Gammaproteobacteria bacterium]